MTGSPITVGWSSYKIQTPSVVTCHSQRWPLGSALVVCGVGGRLELDGHACAGRTGYVVAEGRTRTESDLGGQRAGRCERLHDPGLEAHPPEVPIGRDRQEMLDQCSSDPLAPGGLDRVQRLPLAVSLIQLLEGGDSEELAVEAGAEEHDALIVG